MNELPCEQAEKGKREQLDHFVDALVALVVSIGQGSGPEDDHCLRQAQAQREYDLKLWALVETQDEYDQGHATDVGPCYKRYQAFH